MHNMSSENAEHGKFLRLFPSLLGPRSKMAAVNCGLIQDRPSEPASKACSEIRGQGTRSPP